jgi:cytochrome o ubiquinol oxidase subunit IV
MRNYIYGFTLSILLSLTAYFMVLDHLLEGQVLVFAILALALIQFCVQLIFFLHLDQEVGPRWNLTIFLSTVSLIMVVVVGSLWIMNHLNYNHMSSQEQTDYILHDEGFKK